MKSLKRFSFLYKADVNISRPFVVLICSLHSSDINASVCDPSSSRTFSSSSQAITGEMSSSVCSNRCQKHLSGLPGVDDES